MKILERTMDIKNINLKGLAIKELPNSTIVMAKKGIYVPEKKIILVEQMTEQESLLLMGVKGGLIV